MAFKGIFWIKPTTRYTINILQNGTDSKKIRASFIFLYLLNPVRKNSYTVLSCLNFLLS